MAADPTSGVQDWFDQNGLTDLGAQQPSWLPAGATLDANGTIHMPNGAQMAVPPGYTRDPATGNLRNSGTPTTVTPGGGQQNLTNLGITPAPSNTTSTTSGDPVSQFQAYLAKYPNNPQAAIDAWNAAGDPGGLKPQFYPDKNVIGVTGQDFAYLVAPGTGANPAGGQWQQAGTPNADAGGGGAAPLASMAAPTTQPTYTPPTYTLPTLADIQATPGYQFAQQQGDLGIQQSAVAKGGFGGGTLKDIATYNQGLADTASQQAVNNSLAAYGANTSAGQFGANYNLGANQQGFSQNLATNQYNLGQQNQFWGQGLAQNQNAFNQYNTNQNTAFNQWLALANLGNPGNPYA